MQKSYASSSSIDLVGLEAEIQWTVSEDNTTAAGGGAAFLGGGGIKCCRGAVAVKDERDDSGKVDVHLVPLLSLDAILLMEGWPPELSDGRYHRQHHTREG